ncbi:MAG: hypothetical protein K0S19_1023 [Geminicoccaceae bacterium]|nr:hypothetical protein [Geminicoccaceae bacterium]
MTIDDRHEPPSPHELRAEGRIVNRLEQLERDSRRLRRYTTIMLVVVAMVLGLGAALIWYSVRSGLPGSPLSVSAQQFVLRDNDGTTRGAWGLGEDGAVRLVLNDGEGRQRVRLSLLRDGSAGLSFADSADRKLAVFGLLPDYTTNLALTDPAGIPRAVLGVSPNGSSNLVFADRSGSTRAGLGVDSRGLGTFTLAEREGGGAREELLDTLEMDQADTAQPPPSPESSPPPRGRRATRAQ